MLIEFTVENFRSFRDETTFSFVAADDETSEETHIVTLPDGERVLRTAAIYGANASGKSNLLGALEAMRNAVVFSSQRNHRSGLLEADPFRLVSEPRLRATSFDVVFEIAGIRYQYGFAISSRRVLSEWLYSFEEGREHHWFSREHNENETYTFGERFPDRRDVLTESTRENALFLSTSAQLNADFAKPLYEWFLSVYFNKPYEEGDDGVGYLDDDKTINLIAGNTVAKEGLLEFMRFADVGVSDVHVKHRLAFRPEGYHEPMLVHNGITRDAFHLMDESRGTRRLFYLYGHLWAALARGSVVVIDELGASLHPTLLQSLLDAFHSPETNPKGAQLLFSTHDTSLLTEKTLRRDQLWFTEKDRDGASSLYSLADFETGKTDESVALSYLRGRYGAIPIPSLPDAFRKHAEEADAA